MYLSQYHRFRFRSCGSLSPATPCSVCCRCLSILDYRRSLARAPCSGIPYAVVLGVRRPRASDCRVIAPHFVVPCAALPQSSFGSGRYHPLRFRPPLDHLPLPGRRPPRCVRLSRRRTPQRRPRRCRLPSRCLALPAPETVALPAVVEPPAVLPLDALYSAALPPARATPPAPATSPATMLPEAKPATATQPDLTSPAAMTPPAATPPVALPCRGATRLDVLMPRRRDAATPPRPLRRCDAAAPSAPAMLPAAQRWPPRCRPARRHPSRR